VLVYCLTQFLGACLPCHLGQRFEELVLCVIKIAEMFDVQFTQRIDFHSIPPGKEIRTPWMAGGILRFAKRSAKSSVDTGGEKQVPVRLF